MNTASRTRIFLAALIVSAGFAAGPGQAQTTTVNGVACSSANVVSVTFSAGVLNIQTGGCGGAVVPQPVSTLPPSITGLSVASGPPGTAITITGANLGGATVSIGGVSANAGNNSGTQIFTNVPINATVGAGSIVVTTSVTPAATIAFAVTTPPPAAAPSISLVSPVSAPINTVVTITGTGLTGAAVTIGGVAATIGASSSTSITTTVPANAPLAAGSVVVTTSAGSASSAFTVTAAAAGQDVSIDGMTLPQKSKSAFAIPPFHGGLNGAGSEVNAYAMPPARCNTTPALTRSWQHNIDLDNYKSQNAFDFFVMQANESLSYKFTVGNVDAAGGFVYNDGANAVVRPTFISISTAPCDFDASKLVLGANRDSCYQTGLNGNSVNWANISGPLPSAYCRLQKGTTYYMNIRFQDARPASVGGSPTTDSCTSGNCGGIIQVL